MQCWPLAAAGGDGLVYVCDQHNQRVQVLTKEGEYVHSIGGIRGTGTDELSDPFSVTVEAGSAGLIYVSDYSNRRVQVCLLAPSSYLIAPRDQTTRIPSRASRMRALATSLFLSFGHAPQGVHQGGGRHAGAHAGGREGQALGSIWFGVRKHHVIRP